MSILPNPRLSRQVGLDYRKVFYPSLEQVEQASDVQLLEWHRFLPSPMGAEQVRVINAVYARVLG